MTVKSVRVAIGLGSNVGDPERSLIAAVHALAALPGVSLLGVSRLYATAPVGVRDQPEFRNAAALLEVPAGPSPEEGAIALLVALKEIERAFGRRQRERWGPREIDLDLLLFGDAILAVDRPEAARSVDPGHARHLLEVPHPELGRRLFVLAPLADLAPELIPPGWSETVAEARARQETIEGPDAVRAFGAWDARSGCWLPPAAESAELERVIELFD
jgi:2-amino-4-hydroxy-6-hydroxymethyldihydropteridine diphosphokinase